MAQLEVVIDVLLESCQFSLGEIIDGLIDGFGTRFKVDMMVKVATVRQENELVRRGLSEHVVEVMVNIREATRVNWIAVDVKEINLVLWVNAELINKVDFDVLVQGRFHGGFQGCIWLVIQYG